MKKRNRWEIGNLKKGGRKVERKTAISLVVFVVYLLFMALESGREAGGEVG